MSDFIELPIENIINESQITMLGHNHTKYIVYKNFASSGYKIRVNTYYIQEKDTIKLCRTYDRGLCYTMEEYKNMNLVDIENQAYGSWMDGAR